jgi:putative transposase
MKKSRFTDEQIIGFLKQVECGVPVKDLCRKHDYSDAMHIRQRRQPSGPGVSEFRRTGTVPKGTGDCWRRLCGLRRSSRTGSR